MSIQSPYSFIAAYLNQKECELFANEAGNIVAYVPAREKCEAQIELGTSSYATAEIVAREMGLEPTWN